MRLVIFKYLKILTYFFLILVGVLVSCNDNPDNPYKKIVFKQLASFPPGGRASAVSFSINEKGFVALGRTEQFGHPVNDVWEYNPENDTWTQKNNFPGKARVRATAAVVDGKAYVGLGFNPNEGLFQPGAYLSDWWMYDPTTDQWKQKSFYPGLGRISNFSFVYKGLIYIGSGYEGLVFTNEFYSYNPGNDTWRKLKSIPSEARSGPVACTDGNKIFFGTGFDIFDLNDWWEYFPETDEWIKRRNMPDSGRENAVALNVNRRLFVSTGRNFGGEHTGGHLKSDIIEYNPAKNRWHKRGNLPAKGRENAISFVIGNKGYIGLGDDDYELMNDLWCFEP
jgi:N-acetylneuraminic acid mutarotase